MCPSPANVLPAPTGPPSLAVQAKCDPCLSSPCQNQGTCHNDPLEVYRCACPSGYKVSGGLSWRDRVLSAVRQHVLLARLGLLFSSLPQNRCVSGPITREPVCRQMVILVNVWMSEGKKEPAAPRQTSRAAEASVLDRANPQALPRVLTTNFSSRADTVRCLWTAVPATHVEMGGPAMPRRARMLASREFPRA